MNEESFYELLSKLNWDHMTGLLRLHIQKLGSEDRVPSKLVLWHINRTPEEIAAADKASDRFCVSFEWPSSLSQNVKLVLYLRSLYAIERLTYFRDEGFDPPGILTCNVFHDILIDDWKIQGVKWCRRKELSREE